ncbi:hypothetical protein DT73_02350 [Mangrovibacter sp. MFB070]|uniref:helix-turn-helix domain-containing protein n=1 Tax=Mangrovibacter sp. MFB070 TaxID=1224318 RepID=UPI0004D6C62B|nr:LuxR C-terminal-related transcriptional regulator [Mangrovibacter sp. MFB070]KEA54233.1 hypothetical protein DT73_02350 [Mangrovibacter sp. MFB070]
MLLNLFDDGSLAAHGVKTLLQELTQNIQLCTTPVFVCSVGMSYSEKTHQTISYINDNPSMLVIMVSATDMGVFRCKEYLELLGNRLICIDSTWSVELIRSKLSGVVNALPSLAIAGSQAIKGKSSARHESAMGLLSPTENTVLKLMLKGYDHQLIGRVLGICNKTVSRHKRSLMNKLGVDTLAGLHVYFCMESILTGNVAKTTLPVTEDTQLHEVFLM